MWSQIDHQHINALFGMRNLFKACSKKQLIDPAVKYLRIGV